MTINYLRFSSKANLLKLFFIAAFFLVIGTERSSASHAAGGNLTYTHLAGNQYLVHFTYYRDCFGIPAPTSITVYIESFACNITTQSFNAPEIGIGQEITYPCASAQTTCNGGQAPGIERHDYEVTIALPGQCPDWRIWVTDCCRNAAITTLSGGAGDGIYIEARLNNTLSDNSSPQFNIDPILFVCTNANFSFNNGAVDQEGDSLVYSFIAPRTDANTNCAYNPGYSVLNPISSSPSVNIDPNTGDVSMFPTAIEVGVMVVLITEWRNGELIGSVMRDIQIYTVACSNTAPSTGGINNSGNFATASCAGALICFDIPSSDPDAGDTLTMTYNAGSVPGAATWNTTGVPLPTGHFCWQTTAADARTQPYTFFVTIRDNNCPSNGVQIYSFNILVGGGIATTITSTPISCHGDANGTATITVTGGSTGPFTYLWDNGDTTQTSSGLGAGPHSVTVSDPGGCTATQSITLVDPSALAVSISNVVDAGCGTLGSFDINPSGGTPNYSYYTNTVPPSTDSVVQAGVGTWAVTVQDANGCQITDSVTINGAGTIQATETHTDVTCGGTNDGTATVYVTGGNGNEVYDWTPNVSTGATAGNLAAGTYVVVVSNANCSTTVTIVIGQASPITATEVHSDVTCNGAADGSITITAAGGNGALTYDWTPNVSTGASATGLNGGAYVIEISDSICTTTVNVTIQENSPIALAMSSSPASCLLTNGSATVVATGGAGGYSYSWSNAGTTSTISNIGTGSYTVDVMDANGCIESGSVNVNSTGVSAIISSQTDATCENGDDGSATVLASGGQAPYTYLWSPSGGTGVTASNLAPGTYSVTVTDYLGCSFILGVEIGFINPAPIVDLGADSVACNGDVVTLDAGAGFSAYLWSDNSTLQTLAVSTAGSYGVVVTDGNGCQNSDVINVSYVQCINGGGNGHHFNPVTFSVHPNPVQHNLNIAISDVKNERVQIELNDLLGNRIFTSNEVSGIGYRTNIDMSSFPVGIYMMKVQYGSEIKTIRVIKN